MNITVTVNGGSIKVSWKKTKATRFEIVVHTDEVTQKYPMVSNTAYATISLAPFGQGEIMVNGYDDLGMLVDKSSYFPYKMEVIDAVCIREDNNNRIVSSEYLGCDGYRVYIDSDYGYIGHRNFREPSMIVARREHYKVKAFLQSCDDRTVLATSDVISVSTFKSFTYHKSYNGEYYTSWVYEGRADGFFITDESGDNELFRSCDEYCHYAYLPKVPKNCTVHSYINTPYGCIEVDRFKLEKAQIDSTITPKLSIIGIAYNAEDYLYRLVDSLLEITYNDREIILVNDGSTDETQKIIDWYTDKYPFIRGFCKENGGAASARNYGILNAKGKYLANADSDDYVRPDVYRKMMTAIEKDDCDIAITPILRITNEGCYRVGNLPFEEGIFYDTRQYLNIMYSPGYYMASVDTKIYRTDLVQEHLLKEIIPEDVAWTPYIFSWSNKICYINEPVYEWDRTIKEKTQSGLLNEKSEEELFKLREAVIMFFVTEGNPKRLQYLKEIARRRIRRYRNGSKNKEWYNELEKKVIEWDK